MRAKKGIGFTELVDDHGKRWCLGQSDGNTFMCERMFDENIAGEWVPDGIDEVDGFKVGEIYIKCDGSTYSINSSDEFIVSDGHWVENEDKD